MWLYVDLSKLHLAVLIHAFAHVTGPNNISVLHNFKLELLQDIAIFPFLTWVLEEITI